MPGFAPRHAQTSQLDPTELVAQVVAVLLLCGQKSQRVQGLGFRVLGFRVFEFRV